MDCLYIINSPHWAWIQIQLFITSCDSNSLFKSPLHATQWVFVLIHQPVIYLHYYIQREVQVIDNILLLSF